MSSATGVMQIAPQDMREAAGALGRLSGDADEARRQLSRSWQRLDGGWEWYAAEDINGHYGRAMGALSRMAAVLREMDAALARTVDLIEQADLAAAALFDEHVKTATLGGGAGKPNYAPASAANGMQDDDGKPSSGYFDPDNVGSTDPGRIKDLQKFLYTTSSGAAVAKWLDEAGVTIEFGNVRNPRVAAVCDPLGRKIVLDVDYAYLPDYAWAGILLHEGTHSYNIRAGLQDSQMILPVGGLAGVVAKSIVYRAYPYPEEYSAHRATAEYWREVSGQFPSNPFLEGNKNLIFDENGNYRDPEFVYRKLHAIGYDGWFDPPAGQ